MGEMGQLHVSGQRGCSYPLTYIYRKEEKVSQESLVKAFASGDERLYEFTLLKGQHFKLDNAVVYKELKSLLVDGPLWTYIKKFDNAANGREAILMLQRQMEGESFTLARKNQAYADLNTATYKGERPTGPLLSMWRNTKQLIMSWLYVVRQSQKVKR